MLLYAPYPPTYASQTADILDDEVMIKTPAFEPVNPAGDGLVKTDTLILDDVDTEWPPLRNAAILPGGTNNIVRDYAVGPTYFLGK